MAQNNDESTQGPYHFTFIFYVTDSESEDSNDDSEAEDSNANPKAEESKADLKAEDSNADSEAEDSTTDLEAEELVAEILSSCKFLPDIDSFPLAPPQDFLNHLENSNNESGQTMQSLDLGASGIVAIVPSTFSSPFWKTNPYHATRSLGEKYGPFIPYARNGTTTWESADRAFVLEIRDAKKFLRTLHDEARFVVAISMLLSLRALLHYRDEEE